MNSRFMLTVAFLLPIASSGCGLCSCRHPNPLPRSLGTPCCPDVVASARPSDDKKEDLPKPREANASGYPTSAEAQGVELTPEATLEKARNLYKTASDRYATMDSYIARMKRRERLRDKEQPEELMLFKFRKQPWSVYFKWLGPQAKDREVIYVKGAFGDKIHTLLAAGDMPLVPAGRVISLAADNSLVRAKSRHPITSSGIGVLVDKFGALVGLLDKGDTSRGTLRSLGTVKRAEYADPMEGMEQTIPPGAEPDLPNGGKRYFFFDPSTRLPVLAYLLDDKGVEQEYYCYDNIQSPVKLDDDDFNPEKVWATTANLPKKTK